MLKALLRTSANTAKEVYKWDPEAMVPAVGFPQSVFNKLAWIAVAGHRLHYAAYLAEGQQASARQYGNGTHHIPMQQRMARKEIRALLTDCLPSGLTHIPSFPAPHQGSLTPHHRHSSAGQATLFFYDNNLKYLHTAQSLFHTNIYLLVHL